MSPAAKKAAAKPATAPASKLGPAPAAPLTLVEWRVQGKPAAPQDGEEGRRCRFVPYLDSRDVADLLDSWVGAENWSDATPHGGYELTTIGGKPALVATLAIRVDGEWIAKTDVGVPSDMESTKGMFSDAFKRVGCLKWGAGRNVYDLPTLWAPCRVTRRRNQKGETVEQAWPNAATLPYILERLKEQGYDNPAGRVVGLDTPDSVDDDTTPAKRESDEPSRQAQGSFAARSQRAQGAGKAAAATGRARRASGPTKKAASGAGRSLDDVKAQIRADMNGLRNRRHRDANVKAFKAAFGEIDDLKPAQVAKALALVAAAVAGDSDPDPADAPAQPPDDLDTTVHNAAKAGQLVATLDAEDIEAALLAEGQEVPAELKDARRALALTIAAAWDEDYPSGISDEEADAWWNGDDADTGS